MQNLLSSSWVAKNIKIKINRTIILSFVLYGCKTLSLTLSKERRMKVFENRITEENIWAKRDDIKMSGRN